VISDLPRKDGHSNSFQDALTFQVQIGGSYSVPTFSSGAMSNGHHDTAHR